MRKTSEDDLITLMWVGIAVLVFVGPALMWSSAASWLTDRQILVAAAGDPVIALPGAAGAGLDAQRLALIVGAAALAMGATWATWAGRRGREEKA